MMIIKFACVHTYQFAQCCLIYVEVNSSVLLQVGILDVDLCGPSVPYLLNLEGEDVHQSSEGYVLLLDR